MFARPGGGDRSPKAQADGSSAVVGTPASPQASGKQAAATPGGGDCRPDALARDARGAGTPSASQLRVGVVLLSGSVGAGKSCLVNAMLRGLGRLATAAVCVHSFALSYGLETTAIDRSRVALFEEIFDFGSGCLCCSPRGDFTRFLYRVAQASEDGGITHLLVETTGVAEPLVFAKLFHSDTFLAQRFRLDAIVHVLDSGAPPLPRADDATAPAWAVAAAAQLAAASLVVINVRPAGEAEQPASDDEKSSPEKQPRRSESGRSLDPMELVSGIGGLGNAVLDATSQLASVTIDGASNVFNGAVSSVQSLATGNVDGTADGLGRIGTASMKTVNNSAGVLVEFGALGIQNANDALMVAGSVLDGAIGQGAGAVGDASRASFSFATGVVSAAAAGFMASHGFMSDLLRHEAPAAARVVVCLSPDEDSSAAGALVWDTIAGAGAFRPAKAVELDPEFLSPATPADDFSPLLIATVQGGHAARVTCVCATEAGAPLFEPRLRSCLESLAGGGRAVRIKGLVWVCSDVADTQPRLLMVNGLRESVSYSEVHAVPSSNTEAASCGDAACELTEHKALDTGMTSKLFLLMPPGESAPAVKKAFRECFVPPGYAWAADIEIDFPPGASAGDAPRGIERQLQDGPAIVLWRVGSRLYACEAHCPHAGASLVDGSVLDMEDAVRRERAVSHTHAALPG